MEPCLMIAASVPSEPTSPEPFALPEANPEGSRTESSRDSSPHETPHEPPRDIVLRGGLVGMYSLG